MDVALRQRAASAIIVRCISIKNSENASEKSTIEFASLIIPVISEFFSSIIELSDGEYGAIEIKLGSNMEEEAADNLKKFYNLAEVKPKFMCIICGLYNAVVKRKDGIYVLPITALKP